MSYHIESTFLIFVFKNLIVEENFYFLVIKKFEKEKKFLNNALERSRKQGMMILYLSLIFTIIVTD